MRHIVIPGRAGSKGIPYKNPMLIPYTLRRLPNWPDAHVIVSTDDPFFQRYYDELPPDESDFAVHHRSVWASDDTASMKTVLEEVAVDYDMADDDEIICLYPSYIQRTAEHVQAVYDFYKMGCPSSVLCAYPPETHPYYCVFPDQNWRRVEKNKHYRRQELPLCYAYSHFVVVLRAGVLPWLDEQLIDKTTAYYLLPEKPRDIDELVDLT